MIQKLEPTGVPITADLLSQNYIDDKKSLIIPLTFPDLNVTIHLLEHIGYGGDCWELRVDLLSPSAGPFGKENLLDKTYVAAQLALLQQHSDLPILFTIRTSSQVGKFPDDADKEALELMVLAAKKGCEYIDVEIEWLTSFIEELSKSKNHAKTVASYHSWTGDIRWTSQTLREKYEFADSFGDIVELSILSKDLYDCHELSLFIREHGK